MLKHLILFSCALTVFSAVTPDEAVALLRQRCHQCHSAATRMGNVQLTTTGDVLQSKDRILRQGEDAAHRTTAGH